MQPSLGFPGREGIIENQEILLDVEKIELKQEYHNSYFIIIHIEKKMIKYFRYMNFNNKFNKMLSDSTFH